jgi:hypothetical protein
VRPLVVIVLHILYSGEIVEVLFTEYREVVKALDLDRLNGPCDESIQIRRTMHEHMSVDTLKAAAKKCAAVAIMTTAGAPPRESRGANHGFWISYPTVIVSKIVFGVALSMARPRRSSNI